MHNKMVSVIASLITEDPDVFCEEIGSMTNSANSLSQSAPPVPGADKPLSRSEIDAEANKISDDMTVSNDVGDKMKMQQDNELKQREQQSRILEPQFKEIGKSVENISHGLQQGQQATASNTNQFSTLDQEVDGLQQVINSLERTTRV